MICRPQVSPLAVGRAFYQLIAGVSLQNAIIRKVGAPTFAGIALGLLTKEVADNFENAEYVLHSFMLAFKAAVILRSSLTSLAACRKEGLSKPLEFYASTWSLA